MAEAIINEIMDTTLIKHLKIKIRAVNRMVRGGGGGGWITTVDTKKR